MSYCKKLISNNLLKYALVEFCNLRIDTLVSKSINKSNLTMLESYEKYL